MFPNLDFLHFLPHSVAVRLLYASFLGALIGLERDVHGRAAGLRTNLLVSLGAAVFMSMSEYVPNLYLAGHNVDSIIRSDPARIAANIITGIGFLGAGAIIKSGFSVRGITTAACLWITAAVGMSAGAAFYELATIATVIGLASLIALNYLEKMYSKDSYRSLQIVTSNDTDISHVISVIKRKGLRIIYLDEERDYEKSRMKVSFTVRLHHKGVTDKTVHVIVQDLEKSVKELYRIRWWHP